MFANQFEKLLVTKHTLFTRQEEKKKIMTLLSLPFSFDSMNKMPVLLRHRRHPAQFLVKKIVLFLLLHLHTVFYSIQSSWVIKASRKAQCSLRAQTHSCRHRRYSSLSPFCLVKCHSAALVGPLQSETLRQQPCPRQSLIQQNPTKERSGPASLEKRTWLRILTLHVPRNLPYSTFSAGNVAFDDQLRLTGDLVILVQG